MPSREVDVQTGFLFVAGGTSGSWATCSVGMAEDKLIERSAARILQLLQDYPKPSSVLPTFPLPDEEQQKIFDENHQLAHEIALESVVLLKNDDSVLPLQRNTPVAVIGAFAKDSRYQGMGSSRVTPTRVVSAWDALQQFTNKLSYAPGYDPRSEQEELKSSWIDEAVATARKAEVVLLFSGLPEIMESEGFDRETLELPRQQKALLQAVTESLSDKPDTKIVMLLSHGGVVQLPQEGGVLSKVSSILDLYLLGQACGSAVADLLFGVVSPSGRLAETIPLDVSASPAHDHFPGTRDRVEHREGLQVGYRYWNSANTSASSPLVQYPFGHGLSYTTFEYSQLKMNIVVDEEFQKKVQIQLQLANTGIMAAHEVVQVYIAAQNSSVYRPFHELQAFTKVFLEPNTSQEVVLELSEESFGVYDIGHSCWIVDASIKYEIQVGASSQDIRLKEQIQFQSGRSPSALARESYPPETASLRDDEHFAKRFGDEKAQERVLREILEGEIRRTKVGRNSLLKEAGQVSRIGRALLGIIQRIACMEVPKGPTFQQETKMVKINVENLPLRSLVLFSKGNVSFLAMDALIALMNGDWRQAAWNYFTLIWRTVFGSPDPPTIENKSSKR